MKKSTKFRRTVRENKKLLIEHGFNYYTIQRWINGERNPTYDNATKLANILKCPVDDLPYIKLTIND